MPSQREPYALNPQLTPSHSAYRARRFHLRFAITVAVFLVLAAHRQTVANDIELTYASGLPVGEQLPPTAPVPFAASSIDGPIVTSTVTDSFVPLDSEPPISAEQAIMLDSVTPANQWPDYLSTKTSLSGNIAGRDMSMLTLQLHGELLGIENRIGWHLLKGPTHTHMPSQLFDFELGYRRRFELVGDAFVDFRATVGAYSDFE